MRHVLLPKDYVRFRLSGEYATDVADASGTLMLDVAQRRWSQRDARCRGHRRAHAAAVFESPDICARVSRDAAALTGLPAGTPIVAGAGDQAAGAVGMGITRPGAVSATIGTSGVVFAATDRPATDPKGRLHTFCHAIPGRWHVMGVTQAAGLVAALDARSAAGGSRLRPSLRRDDAEAGASAARRRWRALGAVSDGRAHAALRPERARRARRPRRQPHRGHIVRAVLEGVAFSLRDTFTIFASCRCRLQRVRLGGGGARSALWRQIQADVYGHAVETVDADEGAAYGAAILAGVGAGVWPTVDEACDALVRGGSETRRGRGRGADE